MSNIILGSGETWIPFRFAARLPYLLKGALLTGNIEQSLLSLAAAAITEATTPTTHWAKWRVGFQSRTSTAGLLINPRLVPGYTAPPSTNFQNVPSGDIATLTVSASTALTGWNNAIGGVGNFQATYHGYGWCSTSLITTAFGTVAPASPTLPASAAIAGVFWCTESLELGVFAAGTLAKGYFTSLAFKDKNGTTQTLLTSSTSSGAQTFYQAGGMTGWAWGFAANPFTSGNNYGLTFV
jgi:hypothetical protein